MTTIQGDCLTDNLVAAMFQGDLDADRRVGAHLDECRACRAMVIEMVKARAPVSMYRQIRQEA
jgi:hypothetical protein